jgi:hypothetical protein
MKNNTRTQNKRKGLLTFSKTGWLMLLLMSVCIFQCKKDDFKGETIGICPTVKTTDPASSETGVFISKKITATFNEAMDPSTLNSSTFILMQGANPVAGTVVPDGDMVTFSAASYLAPNTIYTATIARGVKDPMGNAMVADYTWSFTTGTLSDNVPPLVISTDPANTATGVALNKIITATFSESMTPSTINTSTFMIRQGATSIAGAVSYSASVATFAPSVNLTPNTLYSGTITTGVRDASGNAMVTNYTWTFTTGTSSDNIAPTVISTDPANAATNVTLSKVIKATFSETMNPATINATSFTIKQGLTSVMGTISYSGVTASFAPTANLVANSVYTATITTAAKDASGNPMAANYIWTFTTGTVSDNTPPVVISTDPNNGATNVALNKVISATFSEAMTATTINSLTYLLTQSGSAVAGAVTYSGNTAYFTPSADLMASTVYTATITTGAKDLAGNSMASNYVWSFTTGLTTGQAGIDLGSAGNFAILAGAGVTNTGLTIVTGDLGTSPTGTVTGFPPGIVNGNIHAADPIAAQAKLDLTAAYNDAQGRSTSPIVLPGDLMGLTLAPGLYVNSTSVMLSAGNVTLDAQGNPNAIFIFKMGSTLTTYPGTHIILAGGAQAKNIFWAVGTSATLGTNTIFYGTILADQSVSLNTGAVLNGRALTRIAAVTLQSNIVTKP